MKASVILALAVALLLAMNCISFIRGDDEAAGNENQNAGKRNDASQQVCNKKCLNGGVLNNETCTCSCKEGYKGNTCFVQIDCDLGFCQNGGVVNNKTCRCDCPEGFIGVNCACTEVQCQNGGTQDEHTCACKCPQDFTGDRCQHECNSLTCMHGGTKESTSSCTCDCTDTGYWGDTCEKSCGDSSIYCSWMGECTTDGPCGSSLMQEKCPTACSCTTPC